VDEGAVTCWGKLSTFVPLDGRPPRGPVKIPTPRPARRVRLAEYHGCALLRDGAVACFGAPYSHALGNAGEDDLAGPRPARIVAGLPRAVDVAVGPRTSCAVTAEREAWCWGSIPGSQVQQETPKKLRIQG
jgi:hypothetical protein